MIFATFSSNREFSKFLVWKLFSGGILLAALGGLLLVVPQLVAYPLAFLFFVIAFYLLAGAWRVFWTTREMPQDKRDYEDASFRELP